MALPCFFTSVLAQTQACSISARLRYCPEGLARRYRAPYGEPQTGDKLHCGQGMQNEKSNTQIAAQRTGPKRPKQCYCGDKSDGSMRECDSGDACTPMPRWTAMSLLGTLQHRRLPGPTSQGEPTCKCGDSTAAAGYTCLASENKVTLDMAKCLAQLWKTNVCAALIRPLQFYHRWGFAKKAKMDDGNPPCTWPVCRR